MALFHQLSQRRWLAGLLIVAGLAAGGALTWAATPIMAGLGSEQLRFLVWRKGDDIGRHDVRFRHNEKNLVVEIDADIRVKVLLLTIYSFKQRAREEWDGGRLVRFTARTVEDGRVFEVDGRATDKGFRVTGTNGTYIAAPDVLPASYWHPRTASQDRLIDIKTGDLLKVRFQERGKEPLRTPAGIVHTQKYEVRGDVQMTLWYDLKRRLTQAWYTAPEDGSIVEYRPGPGVVDERREQAETQ